MDQQFPAGLGSVHIDMRCMHACFHTLRQGQPFLDAMNSEIAFLSAVERLMGNPAAAVAQNV